MNFQADVTVTMSVVTTAASPVIPTQQTTNDTPNDSNRWIAATANTDIVEHKNANSSISNSTNAP